MAEGGLDFGLLGNRSEVQSSDYKSAGSHQNENLKVNNSAAQNVWEELHTVTTGKTYYVSGILIHTDGAAGGANLVELGTGEAASEVVLFQIRNNLEVPFNGPITTPIKFASDTRIAVRQPGGTKNMSTTLIGWEE